MSNNNSVSTNTAPQPYNGTKTSREQVVRETTRNSLLKVRQQNITDPPTIAANVIDDVANAVEIYDAAVLSKARKWPIYHELEPFQLAEILMDRHTIKRVSCLGEAADSEYDLLAVYQEDGPEMGIYSTASNGIQRLCNAYSPSITINKIREVEAKLTILAPRVERCKDKNLVPVNNGIFDFGTKQLLPFSPDYVFLSKCRVDYNPHAVSPVIMQPDNTPWELEAWIKDLSDDPEIVNVIWEVIGACIRPGVSWDKAAWFYSEAGSNGKGTLCRLMRNLCGEGSHTAVQMSDFSKDFALEPLIRVSAIINDENDVDVYLDRVANLKAIITGDTIQVNRKFKTPIAYRFKGFMVQCINSMPKVKDRSDSFYRRQLIVPFTKTFTGMERRYIKSDYMCRSDVLEYALYRVLNMDYDTLSEPAACKALLLEYKEINDPVRQFWAEHETAFVWDLLPYKFLYDMYLKWLQENSPGSKPLGKTTFTKNIEHIAENSDLFEPLPKGKDGRPPLVKAAGLITKADMLIKRYGMSKWCASGYTGIDDSKKYKPDLAVAYRGLKRKGVNPQHGSAAAAQTEKEPEPQM